MRDIDYEEYYLMNNYKIKYFTPDHIMRFGLGECMEKALQHLGADQNPVLISFNIKAIDPLFA